MWQFVLVVDCIFFSSVDDEVGSSLKAYIYSNSEDCSEVKLIMYVIDHFQVTKTE